MSARLTGVFTAIVVAVAGQSLRGDEPPGGPGALPWVQKLRADTSSYIYRQGWRAFRARLTGTAALSVVEDPEIQAFFGEVRRLGDRGDAAGPMYRFIVDGLHENIVLASGPATSGDGSAYLAVFPCEGAASGGLESAYHAALKSWPGEFDSIQIADPTRTLLSDRRGGVRATWKDGRCFWSVGAEAAEWASGSPTGPRLAESPAFRAAMRPLFEGRSGAPAAAYFHHLSPEWKRLEGTPVGQMWGTLSWSSLESVSGATFVEDGGYRNRHYWKVGPNRTGLFPYSRESRIDPEWLRRVPGDVSGFTTGVWEPSSFVLSVALLVSGIFGQDPSFLAQSGPMLTETLRPFVQCVGPRYLIYRRPGQYGGFILSGMLPLNGAVVVLDVTDRDGLLRAMDGLATAGSFGTVTALEAGGRDVRIISLMMLRFYLSIGEKELILTTNAQHLKDAVDQWLQPGPSVTATDAYQRVEKHIVPDACFEMYLAPGGFSRGIYDQFVPQLQELFGVLQTLGRYPRGPFGGAAPTGSVPGLRPYSMPRGRDIAEHVDRATIISARDDGEGVLFDGVAPVLCTPYYWAYVYAATQIFGFDAWGAPFGLASYMLMPVSPEPAENEPAGTQPALDGGD